MVLSGMHVADQTRAAGAEAEGATAGGVGADLPDLRPGDHRRADVAAAVLLGQVQVDGRQPWAPPPAAARAEVRPLRGGLHA